MGINVVMRGMDEIRPYEKNPRKNDSAVASVAASIKEFGFQQPIVVDADGIIIVGHTRYKAAKKLGMTAVPVVVADMLTPDQVKAYRLADNKTGELADWDESLLWDELAAIEMDMTVFGFDGEEAEKEIEDKYTSTVNIPQYEIQGEEPPTSSLYNDSKAQALIDEISGADVPEDIKQFLIMAAYRHTVFDYTKIAEYYACASEDVQTLMEHSALVIIDVDDAIAGGYVTMCEAIDKLRGEDTDA